MRKYLIVILVAGVLLTAAAVLFFMQTSGAPVLTVDQQKIDYGDVKFGVPESFAIKITNSGSSILRFKEAPSIQVLEGC